MQYLQNKLTFSDFYDNIGNVQMAQGIRFFCYA